MMFVQSVLILIQTVSTKADKKTLKKHNDKCRKMSNFAPSKKRLKFYLNNIVEV